MKKHCFLLNSEIWSCFCLIILIFTAGISTASEKASSSNFIIPLQTPQTKYFIDVIYDASSSRLDVNQKIRIKSLSPHPLQRVVLECPDQNLEDIDVSFQGEPVNTVIKGKNGLPFNHILIRLPRTLRHGESITLNIHFSYPISINGEIQKIAYWYPKLWWGHDTADDYEVKLDIPEKFTVAVSGAFDTSKKVYIAKSIRTFGMVLMQNVKTLHNRINDIDIFCYVEEGAEQCAELIQKTAIDVIRYYREWLSFYPHKVLHIVPGGLSNPAGGYPIATSIVGIHGQKQFVNAPESHWRFITAHEIGHQYWMEHVLQSPDEFWLMIGLGVYADRAYMLSKGYGDKQQRDMIGRYIQGVREGLDTRMNRTEKEASHVEFDYNNVVTHGKGFSCISALACMMGKQSFERAYRMCLQQYKGLNLDVMHFQRLCEEISGQELNWFFDQWVQSNNYLSYELAFEETSSISGIHVTTVKVKCLGDLRMPIPVTAVFKDGSKQCLYTNRLLDESTLVFQSEFPENMTEAKNSPAIDIKIDINNELAMVVPPPVSLFVDHSLVSRIQELKYTGTGAIALEIYLGHKDFFGMDEEALYKLGLCLYDGEYYQEAFSTFLKCTGIAKKKKNSYLSCFLAWQGRVLDILNRREEAIQCYKEALDVIGSRECRHDQYDLRTNKESLEALLKKPFQRGKTPDAALNESIRRMNDEGGGDEALKIYSKIKDFDLLDKRNLRKMAYSLLDGKHYEESLILFRKLSDTFDREKDRGWYFHNQVWVGRILDLLQRRDEALSVYKDALNYCDKNTEIWSDQYGVQSSYRSVEKYIQEPFQWLSPEYLELKEKIRGLQSSGDGEKALSLLSAAEKYDADDRRIWLKLGFCLYDGKHYTKALQAFRKCDELAQDVSKSTYFISLVWQGHICDILNQRDDAVSLYSKALETCPPDYSRAFYNIDVNRQWIEERLKTPFRRE